MLQHFMKKMKNSQLKYIIRVSKLTFTMKYSDHWDREKLITLT